ncbi:MAG: rRNA maturation RNase YbeY [Spirulina sp. SIO3F2]|nr:rRNA maturation RNase YbeY [Spirulina sp. SIO3F2]
MTPTVEVSVQTAIAPVPTEITAISPAQWQIWFNQWLEKTQPVFKLPAVNHYALTLRLCDDAQIQQLNRQYRQQDCPTDVLAFATLDNAFPDAIAPESECTEFELGDIIVSLPTAQAQAQAHDHFLNQEVIWLVSHGFLHLLGWDHPDAAQLRQMLQQQDQLLRQIQIAPPSWANYDKL